MEPGAARILHGGRTAPGRELMGTPLPPRDAPDPPVPERQGDGDPLESPSVAETDEEREHPAPPGRQADGATGDRGPLGEGAERGSLGEELH